MDEVLIKIAFALYVITTIVGLWEVFTKRNMNLAFSFFVVALGVNLLALITRGIIAEHLPFASRYEAIMMYVFSTALIALVLAIVVRNKRLLLYVSPVLLIFLAIALSSQKKAPMPLPPVLKTPLFGIHVVLAFLGYAFYTTNFCLVCFAGSRKRDNLRLIDRSAEIGSFLLGAGIALGAVWAAVSWGNWWAWDPKETWALITFLCYILYLHARKGFALSHVAVAVFMIVGYAFLLMTFLGVNLLISIHAY